MLWNNGGFVIAATRHLPPAPIRQPPLSHGPFCCRNTTKHLNSMSKKKSAVDVDPEFAGHTPMMVQYRGMTFIGT